MVLRGQPQLLARTWLRRVSVRVPLEWSAMQLALPCFFFVCVRFAVGRFRVAVIHTFFFSRGKLVSGFASFCLSVPFTSPFARRHLSCPHVTRTCNRGFLREVAKAGRSAGLRPGPLASFACDSLCFKDTPWAGSVYSYSGTNTIVGASERSSSDASVSWQDHREVFRAVLGSFVSATR